MSGGQIWRAIAVMGLVILAGCHAPAGQLPGDADDSQPWHAISASERVKAQGWAPSWSVQVDGDKLKATLPGESTSRSLEVTRFAGRGGLSFSEKASGEMSGGATGADLTLMVTQGACRSAQSERTYPYTATLRLRGEIWHGCAWSEGGRREDHRARPR